MKKKERERHAKVGMLPFRGQQRAANEQRTSHQKEKKSTSFELRREQ